MGTYHRCYSTRGDALWLSSTRQVASSNGEALTSAASRSPVSTATGGLAPRTVFCRRGYMFTCLINMLPFRRSAHLVIAEQPPPDAILSPLGAIKASNE